MQADNAHSAAPESQQARSAGALRPAVRVHHAAYRCRDAEQTRWFYEDVLGLPLSMTLVEDKVPGLGASIPAFMHLFFALGDGGYVAFFDQPGTATPEHFQRADSFDRHIAFEVESLDALAAWQRRILAAGVTCLGPVDHGFIHSVYMYDPNGLQVELAARTAEHETLMRQGSAEARDRLRAWSAETRAQKLACFGEEAVDRRSRHAGRS